MPGAGTSVQVTPAKHGLPAQPSVSLQLSIVPSVRLYPEVQPAHWLSLAEVQVSSLAQWSTAVQLTQVSALSSCRKVPDVHVVHCESLAEVQVSALVQPLTAVQLVQVMPSPNMPDGHGPQLATPLLLVQVTPVKQPPLLTAQGLVLVRLKVANVVPPVTVAVTV